MIGLLKSLLSLLIWKRTKKRADNRHNVSRDNEPCIVLSFLAFAISCICDISGLIVTYFPLFLLL